MAVKARLFQLVHRSLPAKPGVDGAIGAILMAPGPLHGRQVKNFVAEYGALEQSLSRAQSVNNREALADLIDRMRDMERRIRFVPEGMA